VTFELTAEPRHRHLLFVPCNDGKPCKGKKGKKGKKVQLMLASFDFQLSFDV
jgi:hypothetical protein